MNQNFETRLKYLNDKIDNTLGVLTGNYSNFTEKFTTNNYLRLKSTLSDINNVLTLKLTLSFVDTLCEKFGFSDETKLELKTKVDAIGPNTKGFDIDFENPIKILAEVKCITTENNRFSAIQKKNLFVDAHKLKYKECKINQTEYYKFIVVLDCGDETDKCIEAFLNYKSKKLNEERTKRMQVINDIVFLNYNFRKEELNKEKIYIIKQKI
ncbi:hypothetical protein [Flavobacterium channae]|uniref:hypothetical protein n=1 Tax=Flavobacterium channae TaxID=2897181 RepID=UPI001E37E137|nr:hypothetical protein [Flavobacterium channae]UGS24844.1 hypothetical protein LOS89_06120 [Flavobacterium channae]